MAKNLSKFIRKGSLWTIETLLNKAVMSDLISLYSQTTGIKSKMTSTNIYRGICFLAKCVSLQEAVNFIEKIEPTSAKGFKEDVGQYKGGISAIVGGATKLLKEVYDDETGETVGHHYFGIEFDFKKNETPKPKEEPKKEEPKGSNSKKKFTFEELSVEPELTNTERLEILLNNPLKNPVYSPDGKAITRYQAVYLQGEAGCGKTRSVLMYADKYDLEVVLIPRCTFVEDLLGSPNLDGSFKVTELANALKGERKMFTNSETGRTYMTKGTVILIDELDHFGEDVPVAINNLISQGIITINNKMLTIPENFKIVCAGNTTGYGATEMYGSRNPIDGAFMDRLAYIKYVYEKEVENYIVDQFGDDFENPRIIAEFYRDLRKAKIFNDTNWILSYRGIESFCSNLIKFKSIKEALFSCVIKGLQEDPDALSQIASKMTKRENPIFKVFQKIVKELGAY